MNREAHSKLTQTSFELEAWRSSTYFLRSITILLISCYLFVFYSPSVKAITHANSPTTVVIDANGRLMQTLQQLATDTTRYLRYQLDKKQRQQASEIYQRKLDALAEQLPQQKDASEKQIRASLLQATDAKNSHKVALHKQQLMALTSEYGKITNKLEAIIQADSSQFKEVFLAASKLDKQLSSIKFGNAHHEYDNDTMPFGPLSSVVYKPAQNIEQLKQHLFTADQLTEQSQSRTKFSSAKMKATNAPLMTQQTATENLADYLTFNVDNNKTDRLIDLAQTLEFDAVKMYQYVHNNVEYIPAHGSIQGADYTAQNLRGGAMDQASLLISLLRLSNIPARYVYGSIRLDINEAMNWVGGVETPEAAQNILSQGGVPNTLVQNQQGEIVYINVEHVWLEVNQNEQWIALDPSFKQYNYAKAIDFDSAIDLNPQTIIDNITSGATINESEGWVQNIDQSAIETELTGIQTQIEDYINSNYPNATVEDILGSKEIITTNAIQLPSQLPYAKVITSETLIDLPDNLRHKFGFELKGENGTGTSTLTFERSLPELAGKRLAVSFTPASSADEQALLDLIPENIETPEQLPSELPYGTFNVTANISLNEEVVQSSTSSFAFGQELSGHKGFWDPRFNWQKKSSVLIAGEYQAIGIDTHGISQEALAGVKTVLETTKANIEAETLDTITSHNSTGAIMQAGIYSYLVATKAQSDITGAATSIVSYRQPSYGSFGSSLSVSYYFGVPSKVGFSGVVMDIDKLADNAESTTNCWNDWSDFNKQTGTMLSFLENLIPEQLLSTESEKVDGISAVKALAIAGQQGQKIYTLTSQNAHLLAEITIDSSSKQEIQSALATGKEVTVHQEPINEFGWVGSGYIVLDPDTGAGAYKISGGANGGKIIGGFSNIVGWFSAINDVLDKAPLGDKIGPFGALAGLIGGVTKIIGECIGSGMGSMITMIALTVSLSIAMAWFTTSLAPILGTTMLGIAGGAIVAEVLSRLSALFLDFIREAVCRE
jgi:hypothetical protein